MKKTLILLTLLTFAFLYAQEFPIATASYSQTTPEVVFSGEQYFTVFLDKPSSYDYQFKGVFIESDGTVDNQQHQLTVSHNAMSHMEDIGWGGENYLLAWARQRSPYDYTTDSYGIIIDSDGDPIGTQFAISIGNTDNCNFIKIAYDGNNFLVIWQEGLPTQGARIRGQLVSPNGDLVGPNFDIRPASLSESDSQIYPDLLFNGSEYVVVWDDDRNGNRDIYMQFVGTDGSLIGEDIQISTDTADQLLVQAAYNGTNYFLVWRDERDSSNDGSIYGQVVDSEGNLIGENIAISITENSEGRSWPDVAANSSQFLVSWEQEFSTKNNKQIIVSKEKEFIYQMVGEDLDRPVIWQDVWGRKVQSDGNMPEGAFPICDEEYHQEAVCVTSDNSDFLVTWQDSRNENQYSDIYGIIIEGEATPSGFLEGTVTLNGGSGNVEEVIITANGSSANPEESGYYQMELAAGNYDVTAELAGYETFETSVEITGGNTTTLNIELNAQEYNPPENLLASVNNYNDVELTWEQPSGTGGTLSYHTGYNGYAIG
ncbi:MAG: carboxypeptidase regulatory-like domain-containing protein, partial [Candidatus Cloacimonadota bacterium]|nr:carboxypeptidase regulatory-like domain-containing protein [Candidatus Cloacimonadota bacterium]